jgi:hypothetical protein
VISLPASSRRISVYQLSLPAVVRLRILFLHVGRVERHAWRTRAGALDEGMVVVHPVPGPKLSSASLRVGLVGDAGEEFVALVAVLLPVQRVHAGRGLHQQREHLLVLRVEARQVRGRGTLT